MISATKREEERVTIKVLGRKLINSPAIPGMKIKGKKAATVVIVEVVTGIAISLVPNNGSFDSAFPSLSVSVNVFHNYYGIINQADPMRELS